MSDPLFLYRYRSLDSGLSQQRVAKTLQNNELYFAAPPQLNDPFDCKVHFSWQAPDELFERYLIGAFVRDRADLSPTDREEQARRWISEKKHRDPEYRAGVERGIQKSVDGLGVLCFSEKPDNLQMWSYYASGHTGVCFEFILSPYEPFFVRADRVRYVDNYPEIDLALMPYKDQVDAFLFTKSCVWKHEAEWRIVDEKGPGVQYFPPRLLTSVILGCRIQPDVRDKITAMVNARQPTPRLVEAMVRESAFGLDFREL